MLGASEDVVTKLDANQERKATSFARILAAAGPVLEMYFRSTRGDDSTLDEMIERVAQDRRVGVPATWNRPPAASMTTSSTLASSRFATHSRRDLDQALGGELRSRAADLYGSRATGAPTAGDEIRVAVDEVDAVHRDAGEILHDHAERGAVTLTMRRNPGANRRRRSIRLHVDGAELTGAGRVRDLDVGRDTDTHEHRVIRSAPSCLLGTRRVIVRRRKRGVERPFVGARVVARTRRGHVGEKPPAWSRLRRRTSIGSSPISAA